MSARKTLRSVLWNFLGTYMSRYSEFNGYWLFGFLVTAIDSREFDLLIPHIIEVTPLDTAAHLAEAKFADQLRKGGIDKSLLGSAHLTVARTSIMFRGHVQHVWPPQNEERDGYQVTFRAEARLVDGAAFSAERTAFVAPHDPSLERQSFPGASAHVFSEQ